jgi:nitric oxide synthase oxygenase domain/subunit
MELRWTPPEPKSRWDVLPLVAMAEGDEPAWGDLPSEFTDLINIRHPEYLTSFAKMDLKWVRFPALSRLGFDVGGVQYTASPFIGW